jgi:nucleotide-binding universal stress UspA family protein
MDMNSVRVVMVPVDGSPFAEQALPLAVEISRRASALMQLVRVHAPLMAMVPEAQALMLDPELDRAQREDEKLYLAGLTHRVREQGGVSVCEALLDGGVAEALGAHGEATSADLLVLTTHARSPGSRFWLGSVADHLIRTVHLPILLVPPGVNPSAAALELKRILVPLDGSSLAESALEPARTLGRLFQASYRLVQVVPPTLVLGRVGGRQSGGAELNREVAIRQVGVKYLAGVAARLRLEAATVTTEIVDADSAAAGILAAAERGTDLIAIATHGAGGVRRLLLGSVADKVIRGSQVPVLVYRPR